MMRKRIVGNCGGYSRSYVTCFSTASCKDETPTRRVLLPKLLIETNTISKEQLIECNEAVSEHILCRYHDPNFVRRYINHELTEKEKRRIGYRTYDDFVVNRSRIVVQASIDASIHVMNSSTDPPVAVVLAGGTHHAGYDYGSGYCVFNDIVVSGEFIRDEGLISNYLVIDLDVHQGDGTAQMTKDKSHAYTFSIHNRKNFPLVKQESSWDIALDDNVADDEYLSILADSLEKLNEWREANALHFDIIYYQAGVDIFEKDRLGRLSVSKEGLRRRDEMVALFAKQCNVPLVVTLGGGYPDEKKMHTMEEVVALHLQTVQQIQNVFSQKRE